MHMTYEDESKSSTRLSDMCKVVRRIDVTLNKLEKAMSSVASLLPSEENEPLALDVMNSCKDEVQALEEGTGSVKEELLKRLKSARQDHKELRDLNRIIEEGLSQIESSLKNFGYDDSELPKFVPLNSEQHCLSSPTENIEVTVLDEDPFGNEENVKNGLSPLLSGPSKESCAASPVQRIVDLSETMAGVELTPFIFHTKPKYSNGNLSITPNEISNISPNMKCTPSTSCDKANSSKESQSVLKRALPVAPILSKVTYECLGEAPPLESLPLDGGN